METGLEALRTDQRIHHPTNDQDNRSSWEGARQKFRSYSAEFDTDPVVIAQKWGRFKSKQGRIDVLPVSRALHQLQLLLHQLHTALTHDPKEEIPTKPWSGHRGS